MSFIAATILAPLAASLLILLIRRIPVLLALSGIALGLFASLTLLFNVSSGGNSELLLPGLPHMPLRLIATPLTVLLSTMVSVIGSFVLVYAVGYMKSDTEKVRFFATMLLFIAAMQTLVLAGDWILLLSAWELIGLSSYLLIGFWYQKPGVKSAATRAFMVTRSADLGLYIAVFILIASTGSSEIAATLNTSGNPAIAAGLLLLIAAMGKSAQTPLHDWLQRAMAGPTPVSALLHSATLVAAGAILLIRTAPMLTPETLLVIGIVGGVTTVVTGLIALGEADLKRMLAASTSSQYGLMLVAVGAGVPLAALLHLIAHAAIKSSLFLGAGVFQHSRETTMLEQLRGVGRERLKIFIGFALAALALAGIPPLSGFFSKDAIIAASLNSDYIWILLPFALAGTLLTGSYMARALSILWYKNQGYKNQGHKNQQQKSSQSKSVAGLVWMGTGLAGLVTLAVVLAATFPAIKSLLNIPLAENITTEFLPEILGLVAALSGLFLGWFIPVQRLLGPLLSWANNGFSVAGGFDNLMVRPALAMARGCEKLERIFYEGVLAIGRMGLKVGRIVRRTDDKGIDGFIFSFVDSTVNLAAKARTLQSGLIHKELAISTVASAMILAISLIALMVY
ncbi:NADH-ubiquinone oxidoreductase chain L [hydrothermal vent metagenome]|uniref:NADH-ubiquinone oxidoreductase chain L n=1 Tax=hydrothermal vent metagenome TaxID=652676 RepID=A0A3B1AAA5_9ZZZZ